MSKELSVAEESSSERPITIDDVNRFTLERVGLMNPDLFPSCRVTEFTSREDALKAMEMVREERERCEKIVISGLQEIQSIDKDVWDIVTKIRSGE